MYASIFISAILSIGFTIVIYNQTRITDNQKMLLKELEDIKEILSLSKS